MKFASFGLALGAALAFSSGCSGSKPVQAENVKAQNERKPAPDFALKDADGKTVRLSDYRGKVVLVNFWATWCGPCKIEIPWFMDFERSHKDKGFAVIGVSMDEEGWDVVKPYVNRMAINYRIVLGDDNVAQSFGGVDALPTTLLIDREGRVAAVHVGVAAKSDFENGIEELLKTGAGGNRAALPAFFVRAR
jgi:peroxiredoxin